LIKETIDNDEHYPAMTESTLMDNVAIEAGKWQKFQVLYKLLFKRILVIQKLAWGIWFEAWMDGG
jgi:hypothetical protein